MMQIKRFAMDCNDEEDDDDDSYPLIEYITPHL